MKSIYLLILCSWLSCLSWAGNCGRKGGCGNNQPLFQSPFVNSSGNLTVGSDIFDENGLQTISSQSAFDNSTFNGLSFNSGGARVQCRGGFLFVAGQPIFIGDNGEILVKDRATGQLIPADANTTSQVLSIYQDWARRVESGQLPNDSRFAIAQQALSGNSNGNFAGGFQSPFAGNHAGLGGVSPGAQNQPISDPSIPPTGVAQNSGQATPPGEQPPGQNLNNAVPQTPAETKDPSVPSGSHAGETEKPTQENHPVVPVAEQDQKFHASIDLTKMRVFSDGEGHYFFMNNEGNKIFSGDSKLGFEMHQDGFSRTSSNFKMTFEDSRFQSGQVSIENENMKLACGNQTKDFKEVIGEEAEKALEKVEFKPLPDVRQIHFLAKNAEIEEVIYVSRNKFSQTPESDRVFVGHPGELKEFKFSKASVSADGATTFYEGEGGTLKFPLNTPPSFAPKKEGEADIAMELIDQSKLRPEQLEALIGKGLAAQTAPKTLHTLCDLFEKP